MTAIVIAAAPASAKVLFSNAVPGAQDAATLSFQQMLGKAVAAACEPANTGAARATRASTPAAWDELSAASPDSPWPDVLALLLSMRAGLPSPATAAPAHASIRQYAPIARPSTRELAPELAGATLAIPSSQQLHGIDRGPTATQVLPGPALKVQAAPVSAVASPPSPAPRDGTADEREITDAVSVPSAGLPSPATAAPAHASIRQYAPIARPSTRELAPELAGATLAIPSSQQLHGIDRGPTATQVLPGPALKVQAAPASAVASPPSPAPRDGTADEREITDAVSVPSASTELPEAQTRHPATSALPAGAIADTASAPTGAATTARVSHLIAPSFAQTGWDQAISQRVLWMARGGIQSASLVLNPPQLGPVQVTVQIENQQASVQFVAASPQVQQSLQDALPVLRDMLGQAGIALGQADVGSQPRQQRNPGTASANPFMATPDNASGPAQRPDKTVPLKSLPVRRGLINLYA